MLHPYAFTPIGRVCLAAALSIGLVGCAADTVPVASSIQPSTPAASSTSIAPDDDLYTPGLARQVMESLVVAAGDADIVRVTFTRTKATLTISQSTQTGQPVTYSWQAGEITSNDEGRDTVNATPFDPLDFSFDDLEGLFTQAAEVAGSASNQELQINEYNHGSVMMTVTTNPESLTVFFNPDASMVPQLDYRTADGIAQGVQEAVERFQTVNSITISQGEQVIVDTQISETVVERHIRPATVPLYISKRKDTLESVRFDPSLIDPEAIALLVRTGSGLLDHDNTSPADITIYQPEDADEPIMVVSKDGSSLVTDLHGVPLAET